MYENAVADSILVVYREEQDLEGAKGFGSALDDVVHKVGELSVSTVSDNLKRLCGSLTAVLKDVDLPDLHYALDEVELSVELTGTGEVRLVGSVGASVKGGIKLKFKRR